MEELVRREDMMTSHRLGDFPILVLSLPFIKKCSLQRHDRVTDLNPLRSGLFLAYQDR